MIGTVYGAHLAAAGHAVSVLSHPPRTEEVARAGLIAVDVHDGSRTQASISVVPDACGGPYELVLVAVRADQLAAACAGLAGLAGAPAVVFFGNNPGGRAAISGRAGGDVLLGFPGVGGVLRCGAAEYVRIPQQPTTLQAGGGTRLDELAGSLGARGFAVQRVTEMDGWLAFHAAFVACVAAALYRCGTDPGRLAADRPVLRLMCAAVTEAFAALRRDGVTGLPRNLSVQVFRALLENAASEQGARMSAMDNATRNAGEMIRKQTLTYNRTRQAMITKELIEIISGAEAL